MSTPRRGKLCIQGRRGCGTCAGYPTRSSTPVAGPTDAPASARDPWRVIAAGFRRRVGGSPPLLGVTADADEGTVDGVDGQYVTGSTWRRIPVPRSLSARPAWRFRARLRACAVRRAASFCAAGSPERCAGGSPGPALLWWLGRACEGSRRVFRYRADIRAGVRLAVPRRQVRRKPKGCRPRGARP